MFGLGGGADAEADGDREFGLGLDLGDHSFYVGLDGVAFAGGAGARDVIDETGGMFGDEVDTLVSAGRREEEHGREALRAERGFVLPRFFGRQVDAEDAVHARAGAVDGEPLDAVGHDGVVVREEQDGDFGFRTQASDEREDVGKRHVMFERAHGGFLVHRAVRERIGIRHAELDDVRAGAVHFEHELFRDGERRVAGGDVRDEGLLAAFREVGPAFVESIH